MAYYNLTSLISKFLKRISLSSEEKAEICTEIGAAQVGDGSSGLAPLEITAPPVNGVRGFIAIDFINSSLDPDEGDTIRIGSLTYTLTETPSVAYEVGFVVADPETTMANFLAEVNGDGLADAHPDVTAFQDNANYANACVVIRAIEEGMASNSIEVELAGSGNIELVPDTGSSNITVTGTLTPSGAAGGMLKTNFQDAGKDYYSNYMPDGFLPAPETPPGRNAFYDGTRWVFLFLSGGLIDPIYRWVANAGSENSPVDATGWVGSGGDGFNAGVGTPVFANVDSTLAGGVNPTEGQIGQRAYYRSGLVGALQPGIDRMFECVSTSPVTTWYQVMDANTYFQGGYGQSQITFRGDYYHGIGNPNIGALYILPNDVIANNTSGTIQLPITGGTLPMWLGIEAVAPALEAGSMYKNSGDGKIYVCDGSTWIALN